MRKVDSHIFKGMQRDVSISKQPAEFLWDAHNIRLTAREGNTFMSITNEKGTSATEAVIGGYYVGHCVINDYLTVFTHLYDSTNGKNKDRIYRILKIDDDDNVTFDVVNLIEHTIGGDTVESLDLGFDISHPLQTLGVYENESIQKVYWTDGINQPRFINIVKPSAEAHYTQDSFDFVPKMTLNDSISIRKTADSSGIFGAGMVQYYISYYNKYGQESNISLASPLIPTSFIGRAGSAEERIGNSFEITVTNPDRTFEYLRIYSMFRSSKDATPTCKRVADIKLGEGGDSNDEVIYRNTSRRSQLGFANTTFYYSSDGGLNYAANDKEVSTDVTVPGTSITSNFYVFKKTDYPKGLVLKLPLKVGTSSYKYVTFDDANELYVSQYSVFTSEDGLNTYLTSMVFGARNDAGGLYNFTTADYIGAKSKQGGDNKIVFVDNGTIGDDIDPQELLYIGGESITAETIEQKDGTLFMGNVSVSRVQLNDLKESIKGSTTISPNTRKAYLPRVLNGSVYKWGNSLCAKTAESLGSVSETSPNTNTAGFKHNEHYRLGLQFQYKTGKWSEPIYIEDVTETEAPDLLDGSYQTLTIPTFTAALNDTISKALIEADYVRVRPVVVFPTMQDRLVQAQGVLNPTVYSLGLQENGTPHYQSSWFFRPWPGSSQLDLDNSSSTYVDKGASIQYQNGYTLNGFNNRGAEIQGVPKGWGNVLGSSIFDSDTGKTTLNLRAGSKSSDNSIDVYKNQANNIFCVSQEYVTMHSPDFEFDDSFASLDLASISARLAGSVNFSGNAGDIDIQTSTPAIGSEASGFFHKAMNYTDGSIADKRLCAGLFYWDWLVDDDDDAYEKYSLEKYEFAFMVYPWQRSTSLNNDCNRPSGKGTRSAMLSTKKISNLKFSGGNTWGSGTLSLSGDNPIQLFDDDQIAIAKVSGKNYYGNVDMLLTPVAPYGAVFSNGGQDSLKTSSATETTDSKGNLVYKSHQCNFDDASDKFWYFSKNLCSNVKVTHTEDDIGRDSEDPALAQTRETIRMKYKSAPHVVLALKEALTYPSDNSYAALHMAELYREAKPSTDFGGTSDEAVEANLWYPCGDATTLNGNGTDVEYKYGDTWYQRYDCLKTYAYTTEDPNQVIEIGSFMVETHVNIDGRYDRNRGQDSNLDMSPTNFNLINTVYSQLDNFFNYRILDGDYYKLSQYSSMITWSTAKSNASDVDNWTTVTLASTLEIDGTRGEITALATSKDMIYAFQRNGVTQILFNSRVMISSSDNVPIEISNNYKVDGNRYISTAVGCNNKFAIAKSPNGIYFIDGISGALYLLNGDQLQNISDTHGMGYWFSQQKLMDSWKAGSWVEAYVSSEHRMEGTWKYTQGIALYYDFNKKDLYISTPDEVLCYSELLGQFISFMSYEGSVLFNIGNSFHALTVYQSTIVKLWNMFRGCYNSFFYQQCSSDLTFVSNLEFTVDKTFTNLDVRMDRYGGDGELLHDKFLDSVRAYDEYQDTGIVPLVYKPVISNTKKKFRIWRCDIPRNKGSRDRIRNTWCKVSLYLDAQSADTDSSLSNNSIELHDIGVVYYT